MALALAGGRVVLACTRWKGAMDVKCRIQALMRSTAGLAVIAYNYGSPHNAACATLASLRVGNLVGAVLGVDGSDDVPNVVL